MSYWELKNNYNIKDVESLAESAGMMEVTKEQFYACQEGINTNPKAGHPCYSPWHKVYGGSLIGSPIGYSADIDNKGTAEIAGRPKRYWLAESMLVRI